jgi:hypothetical protein
VLAPYMAANAQVLTVRLPKPDGYRLLDYQGSEINKKIVI